MSSASRPSLRRLRVPAHRSSLSARPRQQGFRAPRRTDRAIMDWLGGIEAHWVWLTLGLLLAALEMLVPGVYLIWLGIAAIVTGVLTGLLHLSLPVQVIDFVFLSLIVTFSARRF